MKENQLYDIFISYRRSDIDFARAIHAKFQNKNFNVFLDFDEIKDGDFSEEIKSAIVSAPIFVIVLSKDYVSPREGKDWVKTEISLARENNRHIIPISRCINDIDTSQLEQLIGTTQVSSLAMDQHFERDMDSIIKDRIIPNLTERYQDLALQYEQSGQWEKALSIYERIKPGNCETYYKLIICHLHLKDNDKVISVAREALRSTPRNPDILFAAALVNLANRQSYCSDVLERASELLIQACNLGQKNEYYCLAYIIQSLYNKQSYRVPQKVNQLASNIRKNDLKTIINLVQLIGL